MLKEIFRTRLAGCWFAAVAFVIASAVVRGLTIGTSPAAYVLLMGPMLPAIVWLVWRGAPPPTVGELQYGVKTQKEGRS